MLGACTASLLALVQRFDFVARADEKPLRPRSPASISSSPSSKQRLPATGWPTDMHDVAALLGELGGARLGGQSVGAVASLDTAGLRPEQVRSLVVIEPPLFDLAAPMTLMSPGSSPRSDLSFAERPS